MRDAIGLAQRALLFRALAAHDVGMCNLYSLDRGQDAIRKAFGVERDETGNLPPLPAIFPDQMAPVVRLAEGERALAMMRWGFPSPSSKGAQHPVTNVRNVRSPYWRPWLKPEQRCLVPVSSFSEYADTKQRASWRPWTGVRGPKRDEPVEEEHRLYAFLTTEANGVVGPVHPKAMPALLTTPEEWRTWLEAPVEEALRLQRPLPDEAMREVARGKRSDGT